MVMFFTDVFLCPGPGKHMDFYGVSGLGHGRHGDIAHDSVAPGVVDECQRRCVENVQFNFQGFSARVVHNEQRYQ